MLSDTEDVGPSEVGTLAGQVAVVTGGGRGVGRAIACHLGAEGARVAVAARTENEVEKTVEVIERAGGAAMAFALDISDRAAVTDMAAEVERELGPVDLLVNDAAVVGPFGPSWEVQAEQWWRVLEINLYGPLLCVQAVLPGMTRRRRGRIVNLAS